LIKNDARYLYVGFDITASLVSSVTDNDWFYFSVDTDQNGQLTPNRDVMFGIVRGHIDRLTKSLPLGGYTWTGAQDVPGSQLHSVFGPSVGSRTPHRTWEMRIPFDQLGVDLSASLPSVIFNFGVSSSAPVFETDSSAGIGDFSSSNTVFLSAHPGQAWPPGTAGVVIGGVGLVPAGSQISADGYATTAASYYLPVRDAAFGGTLNLIGNHATVRSLWAQGARLYRILHSDPRSSAFEPMRQAWTNYHWVGNDFVLENFGPDANHRYSLADPDKGYSIMDLLFQWPSLGAAQGLHRFQAAFFDMAGNAIDSPPQTLALQIDNFQPAVAIDSLSYANSEIHSCDIVELARAGDSVSVTYTVSDTLGHLAGYTVSAQYGDNQSVNITGDSYGAHASPPHSWTGVDHASHGFSPPRTCAYRFTVSATPNVTTGYTMVVGTQTSRFVTIKVPASVRFIPKPIILPQGIPTRPTR
jgi:hypothetical protein